MTPSELSAAVKSKSRDVGFELCGIAPAVRPPGTERLEEWLSRGYAGQMAYIEERSRAYAHPQHVLDGVRSVVVLGLAYRTTEPEEPAAGEGSVSRYAWGELDYHRVIRERLHLLCDWFRATAPGACTRGVVDTAPLLEKEFARLAGLGWIGKNTLLINKPQGSYFFLGAMLTDVEIAVDEPIETDHCGHCTACLDACPTDAFVEPRVLDATRCISYLTIELRDHVPLDLRGGLGSHLFGCDVCQDVCPWNHRSPESQVESFYPLDGATTLNLIDLLGIDEREFRRRFRDTPIWRAHREGLVRNAAIALGNQRHRPALPALRHGLKDAHPLVRDACAWAIDQIERDATTSPDECSLEARTAT